MANGLNRVMLMGNLGSDPELRVTPIGKAVLKMRIATTETYFDRNDEKQERTEWHSVSVWGKRADGLATFLAKGMTVFVEGSLRTSEYEKNGEKRYSTEVVAREVIVPGNRREGEGSERPARGASRPAQKTAAKKPSTPATHEDDFDNFDDVQGDDDIPF